MLRKQTEKGADMNPKLLAAGLIASLALNAYYLVDLYAQGDDLYKVERNIADLEQRLSDVERKLEPEESVFGNPEDATSADRKMYNDLTRDLTLPDPVAP